jgi:integrase
VAILRTLLDTGLRASELCRLKVGDWESETGQLFVRPWGSGQKTKSRYVYLGLSSQKAL